MLKTLLVAFAVTTAAIAFGANPIQKQDDKTVHHAAMHAEHWVDHHVSAPHKRAIRHHKKKSTVKHAIKHAAHWVDHHVSAPHKSGGN